MRRPWPALVLLPGGALMLIALYLPWQRFAVDLSEYGDQRGSVESLLHLFVGREPLEGWDSTVAPAAALAALLLVGLSAVACARPELTTRLPLGRCALAAAYFGVAVAADTRSQGGPFVIQGETVTADLRFDYGAYLGLAGAAVSLLAVLALRRADLRRLRSPFGVTAVILASGLLVAFLLPWEEFFGTEKVGIAGPPAQVAAVIAVCVPSGPRALGLLAALFTAGAFSMAPFPFEHATGAWIGLGLAIGLALLGLGGGIRRPALERVPWTELVLGAAALLLIASFFLPWQQFCYPREAFGPTSGRCVSPNGWGSEGAAAAAILATALIVGAVRRLAWLPPRAELAAGIALLVTTLGFQFGYAEEFDLGYGFWIGAACAAVIVVLAALSLGPPPLDARLIPTALCLAYLAVVVPAWWRLWEFDAPRFLWFAPFSWITLVGALLALTLIRLWLERPSDTRQLLVVPAVIAALAGLDLVRAETVTWGGGIVLALCALLALSAWVEKSDGLRRLKVPEILRIDRI